MTQAGPEPLEQLAQAQRAGIEAPHHIVELAHGVAAGRGYLAELPALAGGRFVEDEAMSCRSLRVLRRV